jgi:hypothetical protein
MTGSERWGLIFVGQEGREVGRPDAGLEDDREKPTPTPTPTPAPTGRFGEEPPEQMGPIVGVHSTSCESSIRLYEGRNTYCEWKFVYRETPPPRGRAVPPHTNPGGAG